jgi:hypothetical protein
MLGVTRVLRRRRQERVYARFLETTTGLIHASAACGPRLSTRSRIEIGTAILRIGEADRAVGRALSSAEPPRIEQAAAGLELARATLADAGRQVRVDAVRRRSLSLVARG